MDSGAIKVLANGKHVGFVAREHTKGLSSIPIDKQVFFAFQKTPDGNGESYASEVFFMRSKDLVSLHHKIDSSKDKSR